MPVYRFQKQALRTIEVEAESAEEARILIIDNPEDYSMDEDGDYYLSDGEEISQ